jgi:hypothetical protein
MKAYKINADTKTITSHTVQFVSEFMALISENTTDMMCICVMDNLDIIFCDPDASVRGESGFLIDGKPIFGNAILLGANENGDLRDASTELGILIQIVRFKSYEECCNALRRT